MASRSLSLLALTLSRRRMPRQGRVKLGSSVTLSCVASRTYRVSFFILLTMMTCTEWHLKKPSTWVIVAVEEQEALVKIIALESSNEIEDALET